MASQKSPNNYAYELIGLPSSSSSVDQQTAPSIPNNNSNNNITNDNSNNNHNNNSNTNNNNNNSNSNNNPREPLVIVKQRVRTFGSTEVHPTMKRRPNEKEAVRFLPHEEYPEDGGKIEFNEKTASTPPRDKGNVVLLLIFLHGIAILMPWNMFITINSYFVDYKLNGTSTEYGKNFLSYLGICSQVPNLTLAAINLFVQVGGSLKVRVVAALAVNITICLLTIVLAMIDTSESLSLFFWLTMLSVIVLNGSNGVYQNCLFGLAADFPGRYTNAIVVGNNFCGTFVSIVSILAIWWAPGDQLSAVVYFSVSTIVLVLALFGYFLLSKQRFYKYHHQMGVLKRDKSVARELSVITGEQAVRGFSHKIGPFISVAKEIWVHLYNVFSVFFVTLTVFPAVQANVRPTSGGLGLPDYLFTPICTFLVFNLFALIGSYTADHIQFPGPRLLWFPVTLRYLLIPFFFFCNYRPEFRTWPVLFPQDWLFVLGGIFMGFTNGYLSSLGMMYAPRSVSEDKARIAGMMAAFFLVAGITGGINFSLIVAWFVEAGPNKPMAKVVQSLFDNSTLVL